MTNDDERDLEEEDYNANLCPLCDYSPCIGGQGKGSCEDLIEASRYNVADVAAPSWHERRCPVCGGLDPRHLPELRRLGLEPRACHCHYSSGVIYPPPRPR
jgi:hypothetical protein